MLESPQEFTDFGVTAELFFEWRSPRFGDENPTPMNNSVWEWLVHTKHSAYTATQIFGDPLSIDAGPGWCFARFGQSCTTLPDGRKVYIAGEHEDFYDPDFYIYNDVIVESVDGSIDIFGYPKKCFPPTDFHSATLVGTEIIIIGNLGYSDERQPGLTQVLALDTNTFVIRQMPTLGDMPGWIHSHNAVLSNDGNSIMVSGGKIYRGSEQVLIENNSDWKLNLTSGQWECVVRREWPCWWFSRLDGKRNYLREIRLAFKLRAVEMDAEYMQTQSLLVDALGKVPEQKSIEALYSPALPHESLPQKEDEYGIYRIRIDGTTVRYVEEFHSIQMIVEGDLPEQTVRQLVEDVQGKLAELENSTYRVEKIA